MSDIVQYKVENGIAQVTLNNPAKHNALSLEMIQGLLDAAEAIKADKQVRVAVIHGEGKSFCGGLDMSLFTELDGLDLASRSHGEANRVQQVAYVWRQLPVPVIAAVHGACVGGGLQIICGADMRYIHPQAKLSIMEIKWGLIPDMAGTMLWRHFVREDIIRELTYSGRIFRGDEAVELGFATRLCEQPLDDALAMAADIASKNPDAIRAAKGLINQQAQAPVAEGLLRESELQLGIIGSANQMEAVAANIEQRVPVFLD